MKDEYMKETLIKILISAIIFTFLVAGICIYMFKPEKSDELESSGEIEEIVDNEVEDNYEIVEDNENEVEDEYKVVENDVSENEV